jgi:hypothetical protein
MAVFSSKSGKWVSTAAAASALGVSERTILRRAAAGKLESRKETTARGVMVVVSLESQDVPTGADIVRTGADTKTTLKTPSNGVGVPTGADGADIGADTTLTAHLLDENRFLRGVIEQLQRDGAETRASLREALKAPRQLTSGTVQTTPEVPTATANRAGEQIHVRAAKGAQNATESGDEVDFDELESLINRVFK